MSATLAITAFLMGLAGGPHCAAMCGAACGAIARTAARVPARPVISVVPASPGVTAAATRSHPLLAFQAGRLVGYATAGAAAALAVQSMAWLAQATAALRPVWTLFHLGVLAWGLMLVVMARQPAWVEQASRAAWARVQPLAAARGGVFAAGVLWAFMPCGLLYSALLLASLSGGPLDGALAMALFAAGSGLSLGLAPALLARLRRAGDRFRRDAGTRLAGAVLALAAAWALWADAFHRIAVWCGLA